MRPTCCLLEKTLGSGIDCLESMEKRGFSWGVTDLRHYTLAISNVTCIFDDGRSCRWKGLFLCRGYRESSERLVQMSMSMFQMSQQG